LNFLKKKLVYLYLKSRERSFFKKENKIFDKVKTAPEYKVCSFGNKNMNKLFYVIKRCPGGGLFSNFLFVLNHLIQADKLNAIPIVDMENFNNFYTEKKKINSTYNSWLYYFDQVSSYTLSEVYKSKRVMFSSEKLFHRQSVSYKQNEKELKKTYKKYINIKKEFKVEATKFVKKNLSKNKVLAVHFRGSDHKVLPGHPYPPTTKQILKITDKLILNKNFNKIFLVTEEKKYLEIFKKKYGSKLCYFNSFRSNNRKEFSVYSRPNHRYKLGKESLIEALILSKISNLVCSRSNISEVAKFLSNDKNYRIYEIMNGFNSLSIIHSLYLWYLKKNLPTYLGGFK
jgi:hypothetical protein